MDVALARLRLAHHAGPPPPPPGQLPSLELHGGALLPEALSVVRPPPPVPAAPPPPPSPPPPPPAVEANALVPDGMGFVGSPPLDLRVPPPPPPPANWTAFAAADDSLLSASEECHDPNYPNKHPTIDVCYSAEGWEQYEAKGYSDCKAADGVALWCRIPGGGGDGGGGAEGCTGENAAPDCVEAPPPPTSPPPPIPPSPASPPPPMPPPTRSPPPRMPTRRSSIFAETTQAKAKCSSIGAGAADDAAKDAARAAFCANSGKAYNPANANTDCAAATCNSATAADITACCTAKAKCSGIGNDAAKAAFCANSGKAYNPAAANTQCAAAACSTGTSADITACCTAKAKCSSIGAGAADNTARDAARATFCGSGKGYDAINANVFCASATCSKDTNTDVAACCIPTGKTKCRDVPGLITKGDFSCGADKAYDVAKKDVACTAGTCDDDDDVSKCCSDQAMCSSIGADTAARNAFCAAAPNQPPSSPLTYDANNANVRCASTTCSKDTPTDVAECCIPPGKVKCSSIGAGAADNTARDAARATFCGSGKGYDAINFNEFCAAVGGGAACRHGRPTWPCAAYPRARPSAATSRASSPTTSSLAAPARPTTSPRKT